MSKTKDLLLARKKELKIILKDLAIFEKELEEVETALSALSPKPTCEGRPCVNGDGCSECRTGWAYR